MPAKKHRRDPAEMTGPQLVKETNRRIRAAMALWDAHRNAACREERKKALALYEGLSPKQREAVPQDLRVWLRYRSEKYFGEGRRGHGANSGGGKVKSGKVQRGDGEREEREDDWSWDDW